MSEPNPILNDYARFPESTRGGPEVAALIANAAAKGSFKLTHGECFWRDLQPFLLSKGYILRPRYTPGWTAPWIGTDIFMSEFEESVVLTMRNVIDARRESDGATVAIKWIPERDLTQHELDILCYVSSPDLQADPRNHCNPLLDSFAHPDESTTGVFVVSPWLHDFAFLPLLHVNEVVDFMLQAFEGLSFLHSHGIAHRDCTRFNILQDTRSAFPGLQPHPQRPMFSFDRRTILTPLPRCVCNPAVRYYFIDFGISKRFVGPGPHLVTGTACRDPTVPELSDSIPYDPFKLDVYVLGHFFLRDYVLKCSNLEFLRPLLLRMTRADPDRRPTIDAALRSLRKVAARPSGILYRWRLRYRSEGMLESLFKDASSLWREGYFQARHIIYGGNELSFGRP